jgi:O-antigen/teichoic acid export membrane protein
VDTWPNILKFSLPFAFTGLFVDLYFNFDMTMLSYMVGYEAVSLYAIPYKFISVLAIIPSAFVSTIWPIFCKLHMSSKDILELSYEKSLKFLIILAIPISFGTIIISDNLILSVFGEEFSKSIVVLKILMIGEVFFFTTRISGNMLGAIDKPELSLYSLLNCTVFNILLNIYLIPKYTYIGAAIATVITEITLFTQYKYHLERNNIKIKLLKIINKPLISSIIMTIILYAVKNSILHLSYLQQIIIIIIIGAIIYLFFLIALRTFTKEETKTFKSLIIGEYKRTKILTMK